MHKPKVSVVVPVYNVSRYLKKCLNSILHQTLIDLEIIIINDCSPDPEDDEICLAFAAKDDRIIYIKHPKNIGLGGARNSGITHAKSDYIAFVDPDDYIEHEMLAITYNEAIEHNRDIVIFGVNVVDEASQQTIETLLSMGDVDGDLLKNFLDDNQSMLPAAWNKLWRKSLFIDNNIFFPANVYFEDIMTTPRLLYFAKNISFIDSILYNYLQRNGSITQSFSKRHIDDTLYALKFMSDFLVSIDKYDIYHQSLENRIWKMIRYNNKSGLALATQSERNEIFAYLGNKIIENNLPNAHYYFPHRYY